MTPTRKRFLLVLLTIVSGFLLYQACTVPNPAPQTQQKRSANTDSTTTTTGGNSGGGGGGTPPDNGNGLQAPSNLNIGISKAYPLATVSYFDLLNELEGGESKFWFYGKSNGNPYPTADWVTSANGYTTIDLPTHSVNARAGSNGLFPQWDNVVAKIEYTIKDSNGTTVFYCKDTKGGYHGSFRPNDRGNNHPAQSQRYLPTGTYTLEFKNISDASIDMPVTLTFGRTGTSNTEFFTVVVQKDQTVTRTLDLFSSDSMFKINCNLLP